MCEVGSERAVFLQTLIFVRAWFLFLLLSFSPVSQFVK